MNILKIFFSLVFYYSGIVSFIRFLNRNKLTLIQYHAPAPQVFEAHLRYISKKYTIISLDEYCKYIKAGEALPKYSLAVSFDDGHKSNAALLSLFTKYKVKPVIYLCSQVVGTLHPFWWKRLCGGSPETYKRTKNTDRMRILKEAGLYTPEQTLPAPDALTLEDIKTMSEYVIWGSHTRTHPILTKCAKEEQTEEIAGSKAELEKFCGGPVRHFAYPNGDYNKYSVEACKKAGYVTARTINAGWNGRKTDLFQLKSIGISDDADISKLRLQLSGISLWALYLIRDFSFTGRKKML